MKCLAKLLDSILNRLAPLPDLGSDWLADYEAEEESTSPGALYRAAVRRRWETAPVDVDCPGCDALFPEGWEDQLHDACADCDDEDSAPRPAPAGADENPGRSGLRGTPTDTAPPVSVGTLHPAVVISRTLRAMGVAVPAVAAESAARELHQFFDITPK